MALVWLTTIYHVPTSGPRQALRRWLMREPKTPPQIMTENDGKHPGNDQQDRVQARVIGIMELVLAGCFKLAMAEVSQWMV